MEKQSDHWEIQCQRLEAQCRHISQQNEDLITLNRELNHRLKNSLLAIQADVQLLIPNVNAEVQLELRGILGRIEAVYQLTQQLQKSGSSDRINLRVYLLALLENLRVHLDYSKENFNTQLEIPRDCTIPMGRANRMGMIIAELIFNAAKHTNQPDKQIQFTGKIAQEELLIGVLDNGPGISPITSEGFGLNIIKEIAEKQLQGMLKLTSKHSWLFTMPLHV